MVCYQNILFYQFQQSSHKILRKTILNLSIIKISRIIKNDPAKAISTMKVLFFLRL
jgi:hypothetical protein